MNSPTPSPVSQLMPTSSMATARGQRVHINIITDSSFSLISFQTVSSQYLTTLLSIPYHFFILIVRQIPYCQHNILTSLFIVHLYIGLIPQYERSCVILLLHNSILPQGYDGVEVKYCGMYKDGGQLEPSQLPNLELQKLYLHKAKNIINVRKVDNTNFSDEKVGSYTNFVVLKSRDYKVL